MFLTRALITDTKILAPGYYLFTVLAPEIAAAAKPGQFVQIRVTDPEVNDPLLPRPISLFQADTGAGTVSFIFKVAGRGTGILAQWRKGELLWIQGPIGNGFEAPDSAMNIALIAGGIGMPPLYFFAETLRRDHPEKKITLFYGGRAKSDLLVLDSWAGLDIQVQATTDDGSFGFHGLITALLLQEFRKQTPDFFAACGPKPMLRGVQEIAADFKIPGQISLEEYMACGVGACLGCICRTSGGYRRVCVDGPVFAASEVTL